MGPSLCGQDSPPTPWALQASFAGTAARAVEGGGAGVVYTSALECLLPFVPGTPAWALACRSGLDPAEERDGGNELWAP